VASVTKKLKNSGRAKKVKRKKSVSKGWGGGLLSNPGGRTSPQKAGGGLSKPHLQRGGNWTWGARSLG